MARARTLRSKKPKIPGLGTYPSRPGPGAGSSGITLPGVTRPKAQPNKPGRATDVDKEGFVPPGRGATVKGGKIITPKDKAPKGKGKPPKGKPKGGTTKGGTTKTLTAQQRAEQEMQSIYGPVLGEYARLIKSRQAEAAAEAARKQAVYAAFAKYYQEHAPQQIQGIYSQAAAEQSAWGKGYSLGMQLAQQEEAAQANKVLGVAGAPSEQMIRPGPEAGNVIYGLGGGIPANTLSQQGAAFAGAAALQSPAIMAEGGRQANELLKLSSQEIEKLRFEELQVRTEMRAKVFERVETLRAANQKAKADRLEALQDRAEYLTDKTGFIYVVVGNKIKNTKQMTIDVALKQAALTQAGIRIDQGQQRIDLSRELGISRLQLQKANLDLSKLRYNLSLDKANAVIYRKVGDTLFAIDPTTGQFMPLIKGKSAKEKKPTYTPTQRNAYRADIQSFIRDAINGFRGKNQMMPPLSFKEAMDEIQTMDVPLEMAVPMLAKAYGMKLIKGVYSYTTQGLGNMSINTLGHIAKTMGYVIQPGDEKAEKGRTKKGLINWILQVQGQWLVALSKANAASSGGTETATFASFQQAGGGSKTNWLATLWVQAGGDPSVAGTAAAIAMAESGGRVDAWNPTGQDRSAGLWQINYYGKMGPARTRLFGPPELLRRDPLANAKAAVAIYKSAGNSFSPWSTYNKGLHSKYLGGVPVGGSNQGNFASASEKTGGAWQGSLRVADKGRLIAEQYGLSATGKRSKKMTASGGVSDHWVGSKNAFAYDLSGSRTQMHNAALALAQSLGIQWDGLSELIEDVYIGDFRIQIIYNTPKYGGHMDHIHFGVRRVRGYGGSGDYA